MLVLILGPSGSGKGTVIEYLKKNRPDFVFPASYTTRKKRKNEKEGDVYHYINKVEFEKKIKNEDFLEWAMVHEDNMYGTDKNEILSALDKNKIIIREVDIQGVKSIKKLISKDKVLTIFITTDSWNNLKQRIINRAPITEDELMKREKSYEKEIKYSQQCDYVIYSENNKIEKSFKEIDDIFTKIGI